MKTINGCTEKGYKIYWMFISLVCIVIVLLPGFLAYQIGLHEGTARCTFYSRLEMVEILRTEGYYTGNDTFGSVLQDAYDLRCADQKAGTFMTPSGGPE